MNFSIRVGSGYSTLNLISLIVSGVR
ncbi:uncharacterized protein METZ01_LOCUS55842 [marine metagenome]|uniref:Uncharacterized protein n=1 Tax=marine metagenome TaxID=408172 RepID=A0A381SI72_9ZZZZ